MNALAEIEPGTAVSLEQVLAARERRVARQSSVLEQFNQPLVSITIVMPGPVKDGPLPRRLLELAVKEVKALARARKWPVLSREISWRVAGPEAINVIAVDPEMLKRATVELEDRHPLGRLWDLDVISPGRGGLSRKSLALPPRRCLVCDQPAYGCSRSRRHAPAELQATIQRIVGDYDQRASRTA